MDPKKLFRNTSAANVRNVYKQISENCIMKNSLLVLTCIQDINILWAAVCTVGLTARL